MNESHRPSADGMSRDGSPGVTSLFIAAPGMMSCAPEMFRPLHGIAEVLAVEFCALPIATVVRVLTECADELPESDSLLVEAAARARLHAAAQHPC